jgi:hypothetical protein
MSAQKLCRLWAALIIPLAAVPLPAQPAGVSTNSSNRVFTKDGLPVDTNFFPMAVWCHFRRRG